MKLTWRTEVRYFAGSDRKALASEGLFSRRPSNSERAKVRQWSMLCGKECTVHMGACFSGGSLDAPAACSQSNEPRLACPLLSSWTLLAIQKLPQETPNSMSQLLQVVTIQRTIKTRKDMTICILSD